VGLDAVLSGLQAPLDPDVVIFVVECPSSEHLPVCVKR
jgi:hypothetical protein